MRVIVPLCAALLAVVFGCTSTPGERRGSLHDGGGSPHDGGGSPRDGSPRDAGRSLRDAGKNTCNEGTWDIPERAIAEAICDEMTTCTICVQAVDDRDAATAWGAIEGHCTCPEPETLGNDGG